MKAHKFITLVAALVLFGGGYLLWGALQDTIAETQYVMGTVEKGTIIASVSGTGQVSASNEVTLTSKTSGAVTSLNVAVGQKVNEGALIAAIDASDALFQLESARISYDDLVTVDDQDRRKAEEAVTDAETALTKTRQEMRSTLASMMSDMTDTLFAIKELQNPDGYLNSSNRSDINRTGKDYLAKVDSAYWSADEPLDNLERRYKTVSSATSDDDIAALLAAANNVAPLVSQAAKTARDAVTYLRKEENKDQDKANSAYTTVDGLIATANNSAANGVAAANAITTAERTLRDAKSALADLLAGPDTSTLRSSQLTLRERQKAYADYFIRAPFAGTIASVDVKRGETVGSNTSIATLITDQKIAEITLNEVDIVKVKVGQKATLTFDAVDDFTITGEVVEVAMTGTVSQGVVTYGVKIAFDTDDERIRPGMTVNASIISDIRQDVLAVPSSAIKTQNGNTFVQVLDVPSAETTGAQGVTSSIAPRQVPVETGLSDDLNTEIVSGLAEGDQIVVRTTTTSSTQSTTASAPSLFGSGFGGGTAGRTRSDSVGATMIRR